MIIPLGGQRYFPIPAHPSVRPEFIGINVPVEEAPWPLPVIPTEEDIAKAIPCDPFFCMYAVNIRRVWSAPFVAVEHGVCGAVIRDENGNWCFYRWFLTPKAEENTKAFDAGKKFEPHATTFRPPRPSETLAAKAVAHLKWELKQERAKRRKRAQGKPFATSKKPRRKAHVTGTIQALSADQMAEVGTIEISRKSGKGMFQFKPIISGSE